MKNETKRNETMKFLIPFALILSHLSLGESTGEQSKHNLRGLVSKEVEKEVQRPPGFLEYLNDGNDDFGTQAATNLKYPADNNNDKLLVAYSIQGGIGGTPFQSIYNCNDEQERDDDTTCYDEAVVPPDRSRHYDALIESTSTRDSLLSTITKAEGGSVGIKVSASASYVSEKSDSSQSISFMIGGYRATQTARPRDFSKLKLTDAARNFLAHDAPGFLETYGDYYVQSITYGGSFIGSFDLSAGSSADSADLEVEAAFKYKKGLFTASGSTEFIDRQSSTATNLRRSSDYISRPGVTGRVIEEPYDLTTVYDEWNELVEESSAPLYLNIGRWWDSQDVQNVLLDPENGWDQNTRNLFTKPLSINEDTVIVATNERVASEMVKNALDEIKDWPEVTSSNTLSATAEELYKDARSYSGACTEITDIQLAYLQSEIIRDETQGIDNQFDSWLHYEKSLGPRYAEFMKSMPAVQDKKMDIYRYRTIGGTQQHHWDLLSSTIIENPIVTDEFWIEGSFCSPRLPTEGMKMMEVSFSVEPFYHHKISTQGIEDEYSGWEPRETLWVYDSPAEGLTNFFVYKYKGGRTYVILTTASNPKDYEYSESFYARLPEDGSCERATASPTKAPIAPTAPPTNAPTAAPTVAPTISPTTTAITKSPTKTSIAPTAPPTNAPTASPTASPTVAPTISPTTTAITESPTKTSITPTAPPTIPTTSSPTISPSSKPSSSSTTASPTANQDIEQNPVPAPVQAPTAPEPTGDGNGCCSQNFRTCASYGGDSKESCESMGSMIWLENGDLSQQCLEQYNACTDDINACCPGLTCDGSQWYKQCILK